MRYGDGGGLDQAARVRREQVRRQAADLFAQGMTPVEVAKRLEVSQKSAYVWRKLWQIGGAEALASKGAPGPDPKLSDAQLVKLKARLELGPAAAGYGRGPALDAGQDRDVGRLDVQGPPQRHHDVGSDAADRVQRAVADASGDRAGRGSYRSLAAASVAGGKGSRAG